MMKLSLWKHIYYSVRYGEWIYGFETRATWTGKPYWAFDTGYYDGWYWVIHIGSFYLGAHHY